MHLDYAGQGSVWFTWVAPWNGDILFTTEGSASLGFIVVYAGTTLTDLTPLTTAYSTVAGVLEGQRYFIVVNASWDSPGMVRVSVHPPPTNDDFAHAIVLTGLVGSGGGWIEPATLEPGEPAHRGGAPCKSLWWKWQAPQNGRASFHNNNSLATNPMFAVSCAQ